MDVGTRAGILIVATGVVVAGLYWLRDILAPFALAVFLWLIMDGFADAIRRVTRNKAPFWLALTVASVIVTAGAAAVAMVIADSAGDFARGGRVYERRIDELIAQGYAAFGAVDAPTVGELFTQVDPARLIAEIGGAFQSTASDAIFVFIYVAFLFAAQASFPKKMIAIFPETDDRAHARRVIGSARQSIERYLWVQTVLSLIISALSYVTLLLLGVDNPLFWTFLIFLLNYVPTVGSIVAAVLPTVFALVQFPTLWQPLAVFAGLSFWQFAIGNFVQPRILGDTLNLATIVVLLSLAIWGAIWGIPGMFLSAPLTVMLMIFLAQFASTRWIAVLLSADGRPDIHRPEAEAPTAPPAA